MYLALFILIKYNLPLKYWSHNYCNNYAYSMLSVCQQRANASILTMYSVAKEITTR